MLGPQAPSCTDQSGDVSGREQKRRPSLWAMMTKGPLGNFMALIFCMQIASKSGDHLQTDIVSQRAAISTANPLQHSLATNVCVRLSGGKDNKVPKNLFRVPEFVADSSASSQVPIDSGTQHDASSGHGWAACFSRWRSTFA